MEGYRAIGKLGSPYGSDGRLKAFLDLEWENMEKGFVPFEAFFVEADNGLPLPYFIEEFSFTAEGILVKLEEVDSKETTFEVAGKVIYLPQEMVEEEPEATARYSYLTGFNLIDRKQGALGVIEDIFVLPMQEVAQVTFRGKELLLPLNEDLILDIDGKNKIVRMDLPEGLTELDNHED